MNAIDNMIRENKGLREVLLLDGAEFTIPFLGSAELSGLPWRANKSLTASNSKISAAASGALLFEKNTPKTAYFIHNGSSDEFATLQPASGVPLAKGCDLFVDAKVALSGNLRCAFQIIEFDAALNRIGTVDLPLSPPARYVPPAGVARILLTVRFRGCGQAIVDAVRASWTASIERTEATSAVTATPPAVAPGAACSARAPASAKSETLKSETGPISAAPAARTQATGPAIALAVGAVGTEKVAKTAVPAEKDADAAAQESAALARQIADGLAIANDALGKAAGEFETLAAKQQRLERDVYTWRRRALGWEKKYKTEPQNRLTQQILVKLAADLPVSNGTAYYQRIPLKVGVIADIYMYNFYKDSFEEAIYLSPSNHTDVLATRKLDAFLYTTCWAGIANDEWRGIKYRPAPSAAFAAILEHCKKNKIRTIFQSIEDPSNFDYFIDIAGQFDCIFTTDQDILDRYRHSVGHDRVFFGEFGANPVLNNPIGCRRPAIDGAFFAGSYPTRYKDRCDDMEIILDSLVNSASTLVIANRNYGAKGEENQFPERFRGNIIPQIDHALLQSVHKLFRYNLNFNSIKNSSTMCAMRVYELQAQGRAIISSYARSVYNNFPNVPLVVQRCEMESYFGRETLEDYRANMAGVRAVLSDKTSFDVAARMMVRAGLLPGQPPARTVAVIADEITPALRDRFARQHYGRKILLRTDAVRSQAKWEQLKREHDIAYFTFFSEDDDYEEFYLTDLVNGFKYTKSSYVTKAAYFRNGFLVDGAQHEYTGTMAGRARTLFAAAEHCAGEFLALKPHEALEIAGGYAIDPFELNYARFLAANRVAAAEYALSVIVPVYNNGRFLRAKCIASLLRNKCWKEIEIILVDDGSTDVETREICAFLCNSYANVKVYYFEPGGSGSASRPRNKGIDLANAPLVAFLDPDNEISPGGYDTLLGLYREINADTKGVGFVSGYQVKVAENVITTGRHTAKRLSIVEDLKAHFFDKGRFPVVSTQAAVIDRNLFADGRLRFVETAAGQDTLFGWELLARAGRGAFTGDAFLIYYARREGSVTNAVSSTYFAKKIALEREQVRRLKDLGLFERYLEAHFDTFMTNWYLKKLEQVEDREQQACRLQLAEIVRLYGREPRMYGL